MEGNVYKKPYGRELFGREEVVRYVYPREEMIKEEIFPYFVMDGGAFNFANDTFGGVDGKDMLEKVMSGELFKVFQNGSEYNWEKSFAYTGDTDFRKKYEWQIWPQRLYMILPPAHAFLRTGEKKYADKWLEIVRGWDQAHPYQPFDASITYFYTDMVWRDMQVAWRTLSLLHSLFMLQDAPFTKDEWAYLYDFVKLHANHLYVEAKDRLSREKVQNHVLQIGTALILAGTMFPEFEDAKEYIEIGKQVLTLNMRGIKPDGGSEEDSPSYSHFIARLYLEAYLLLKNNDLEPLAGLKETVWAQYNFLYQSITPVGNAPRISDSFSMDARADLERVSHLIPLELPKERKSVYFKDSDLVILRKGEFTLYVDALNIPRQWGHIHTGRPQTLLYHKDRPILTDMGICSYDRWEFYNFVDSISNHNVVISTDINEADLLQETGIEAFSEDSVTFASHVTSGDVKYVWRRTIELKDDEVLLKDTCESDTAHAWRSRLLFERADVKMDDKHQFRELYEDTLITVTTDTPYEWTLSPMMNDQNKIDYGLVIESRDQGIKYENTVRIRFEKR